MSIILFIVVIAVLIFVHELGHFFAAKKSGIRVDEFAIGFPPKIFSKKVGETKYSLNLIPFGGFVKIFGENPDDDSLNGPDRERSFVHKPNYIKVIVLFAGVFANIIFAWLLFSISFATGMTSGTSGFDAKYYKNERIIIASVLTGSPAETAGFKAGDEISGVTGVELLSGTFPDIENVQKTIRESNGGELSFQINRNNEVQNITVIPELGVVTDGFGIGLSMDTVGDIFMPIHLAILEGAKITVGLTKAIAVGFYGLIAGIFDGTSNFSQLSGPVGIAKLVGEAGQIGFAYLLSFTAFISLNLAVLNLLPFPALDGGRILFVIIESIKRSPIKPVVANTLNFIGFGLLILLMLYVTVKDVLKLF